MNFYNLVSLINQSIQALDTHPNQQLTPLIDDLTRAKAELNRLISRQSSEDPVKDYMNRLAKKIVKEKESLADSPDSLAHQFEIIQELFRLGIILEWVYDEIYLLEKPHPLDTP